MTEPCIIHTPPVDGRIALCQHGYSLCTPERPYQDGDRTPVVHPLAYEVGEQQDGWPAGAIVTMECPTCGTRWRTEQPQ